jgi:hypothetical protein
MISGSTRGATCMIASDGTTHAAVRRAQLIRHDEKLSDIRRAKQEFAEPEW